MSNRDELRQAVTQQIGDCFAMALSGNRMPHMSGDPRARLLPHQLRELEDCAASAADAAIAAYEAHRPRADVVLTQGEWASIREDIYFVGTKVKYNNGSREDIIDAIRAAFPWLRVEGE
jgi:hypothetical protein